MLELRRLELRDEKAFLKAMDEWDHQIGFIFAQGFTSGMTFPEYVSLLQDNEKGLRLAEGFVPATILCAFQNGEVVGRVSLRHRLNDFLLRIGGHIGYGVVPRFRRKGYAKEILRLTLPLAREMGMSRVLVTCDDDNVGSYKTIEACGGRLENRVDQGEARPQKCRYWIDLT